MGVSRCPRLPSKNIWNIGTECLLLEFFVGNIDLKAHLDRTWIFGWVHILGMFTIFRWRHLD